MPNSEKVRYLKIDRGRFFYQRRIPLAIRDCFPDEVTWRRACGSVTYSKAVQLVVTWAEEHDKLIAKLADPEERAAHITRARRSYEAVERGFLEESEAKALYALPPEPAGLVVRGARESQPNWLWAKAQLAELETLRKATSPTSDQHAQIIDIFSRWRSGHSQPRKLALPPFKEYIALLEAPIFSVFSDYVTFDAPLPKPLDDDELGDRLKDIYDAAFGSGSPPSPSLSDEREEHFFIKKKLERKISETKSDPNTIHSVLEDYISFNQIKPLTARKYRRNVSQLVLITGNVPIAHLQISDLKQLRDALSPKMKSASLHAVFSPIKGILRYAFHEGLIDSNPALAIALPKDKRPIEERKWKKFEPHEVNQINLRLNNMRKTSGFGLTEERQIAFVMVVRTLMFSGMRPIEVLRLKPEDVTERYIRVTESKTESSTRIVPLHPEIVGFYDWIHGGGLKTYDAIHSDPVSAIRHNFTRLIRFSLSPPILEKQKALYSLRSTFVNAMRRAGANIQMQRAILGHKESGAIRHYDDGPEFEEMYQAVARTDPRVS